MRKEITDTSKPEFAEMLPVGEDEINFFCPDEPTVPGLNL
jgi:hypothetical protein